MKAKNRKEEDPVDAFPHMPWSTVSLTKQRQD